MFQDYKDLLSAFNAHGVRYLIVGGYAESFYAQPRATKAIDFFAKAARWTGLAEPNNISLGTLQPGALLFCLGRRAILIRLVRRIR
jgi:hypothetical protein